MERVVVDAVNPPSREAQRLKVMIALAMTVLTPALAQLEAYFLERP